MRLLRERGHACEEASHLERAKAVSAKGEAGEQGRRIQGLRLEPAGEPVEVRTLVA